MSDCGEQHCLLQEELHNRHLNRRPHHFDRIFNNGDDPNYYDDNWTDTDSSSCSSYFSDCNASSIIEWESEVSPEGELFYVESFIQPKYQKQATSPENVQKDETASSSTEPSKKKITTTGKLVRLIRRRSSRRSTRKKANDNLGRDDSEANNKAGSKVTFRESQEGECREVVLQVMSEDSSLGRRATHAESLLGLVLSTFSDKTRIMVAGFIPNSQASKMRNIKIGDWLKSINREEVNYDTLNTALNRITSPCEVFLTLQRVAECEITQSASPSDLQVKGTVEQSDLVKYVVSGHKNSTSCDTIPFWILYVTLEGMSECGPQDQGVVYCFPEENNTLCAARGAFITINHLVPELTTSSPLSSSIIYEGCLVHIIYTVENKELLLLAVPDFRCTLREAELLNADVVRSLKFSYQTLSRCFNNKRNHSSLNRIFSLLRAQYLETCQISMHRFEDLLPAAHLIALPRDAQVQIDDALSEFESNDFGGYNEDKDCQRLYTIIGSCLFYKGYLLSSHLMRDDLADINAFCRHNGLLSLNRTESVKNIVFWKEVFPASCNRGLPTITLTYFLPQGRWFLALVGQEESLLAILLESGGCTVKIDGNPGPESIYIKQAQATLQHIKEIEVLALADKWIANNCRIQTVAPDNQNKVTIRTSTEAVMNQSSTPEFPPKSSPSPSCNKRTPEVTSILKHRISPDEGLLHMGQYETSEDSVSQAASSVVSDEAAPILGRRAEREHAGDSRLSDSDYSDDSDWPPFKGSYHSSLGSRLFDISDLGRTLSDVECSLPIRLTAGDQNALFHYVHLDSTEGVLLAAPTQTCSGRLKLILDNFRLMAPLIHDLLQNTTRFKKLKVQEVSECLINKSLIANKEHALLFECPPLKDELPKKMTPLTYWVVGRLFFMPLPREVYVCYQDSAPQNLVEIAFRLALSASG